MSCSEEIALKKSLQMREGKSLFENKIPKLNQWLPLVKILFSERFSYPDKYSWEMSNEYWSGWSELTEE